jgi:hypothetical protein
MAWMTWRGALQHYYGTAPRPIRKEERAPLMAVLGLLSGLGMPPAEWIVFRLGEFSKHQEKIGTKVPPFNFVWSQKAVMDEAERETDGGYPNLGMFSVRMVVSGRDMTTEEARRVEEEWQKRADLGEFLWAGALK